MKRYAVVLVLCPRAYSSVKWNVGKTGQRFAAEVAGAAGAQLGPREVVMRCV